MADLFADSEDSSEEIELKTENEYAKRYDTWRQKEELHKLEQKYGENATEADLESSESDDDEPLEVPEKLEKDFLKTLSLLKTKDPRIYDPNFKFFNEENKLKEKAADTLSAAEKPAKEVSSLAAAFGASDDEEDNEIFKVEKSEEKPKQKEDKLKEFLTGKAERLGDGAEQDLAALKALWSNPKLDEGEAFLRDYILQKKYLAEDEEGMSDRLRDDAALEADEAIVEEQGKFERAYNFRFEEPDQEFLKRYPRTIGGTRPKDDRRARKRTEVRDRKQQEKTRKMEEIARLKALKWKEIQEKIEQIKRVTGNKELALQDADIEGDFNPAEHDRRMAAIFNEEYYGEQDAEKPVFPDLDEELEIENWDKYEEEMGIDKGGTSNDINPHCEDEDFNMDAEYDPKRARASLLEEIQETLGKKRRNRKRKTKLAQILSREKPRFEPATAGKSYAEHMEEYYKMDCEDVIGGDLPTRFKYREVVPNSYGLTIEEILLADDKELNKWVPLKKAVKYRPEHVEKGEVKTYQLKANDVSLKQKLLPSLFKEIEEPETTIEAPKKKKKKKKNKNKAVVEEVAVPSTSGNSVDDNNLEKEEGKVSKTSKKKKKLARLASGIGNEETSIENNVDMTKDKHKKNRSINSAEALENNVVRKKDKSKKKKKHLSETVSEDVNNLNHVENKNNSDKNKSTNVNNYEEKQDAAIENDLVKPNLKNKRKKKNKSPEVAQHLENTPSKDQKNKKRKLTQAGETHGKKMKFNPKQSKNVKQGDSTGLSDERLKAYGLNPKKYRNFLKHKKF